MYFGACYYPEHWPEERWETDMKLMQEAGLRLLRVGEFSWAKIEPQEGEYDFSWLDRALALMERYGIKVMMGTPTAAPPQWLMNRYPDIYPVDEKGIRKGFGTRRHYCFNQPDYHRYAVNITEKMAEHYKNHPQLIAWQIDNEFGMAGTSRCYCSYCRSAFQKWLKNRYKEIDALNEAWGTVYWSQTYQRWEDVILPAYTTGKLHNPGLQLDYRRFCSDAVADFQRLQAKALKQIAPHQQVSTNFMGVFPDLDYDHLAKDLDVASLDVYPNMTQQYEYDASTSALEHVITRSLKKDNHWVTEMQSGPPGGDRIFRTPVPGELRTWTYQSIAHGADAIMYFRWRTILFGNEQFWHGILPHSGKPTRRYHEVKQIGEELERIGAQLDGSYPRSNVAIMRSYDNQWAFEIQPQMEGFDYTAHLKTYFDYFHRCHINTDIISPSDELTSYDMVVIPSLYLSHDELAEKIKQYVLQGGVVLLDIRSGAKSWDSRMEPLTLPGKYADLLGIEIEDYGIIQQGKQVLIQQEQGQKSGYGSLWYDVITAKGAEGLAHFAEEYYQGHPAATRNHYGKGLAYYLGTVPDQQLLHDILDEACRSAGVASLLQHADQGIEAASRSKGGKDYWFVINHLDESASFHLPAAGKELLENRVVQGTIEMKAKEVMIIEV